MITSRPMAQLNRKESNRWGWIRPQESKNLQSLCRMEEFTLESGSAMLGTVSECSNGPTALATRATINRTEQLVTASYIMLMETPTRENGLTTRLTDREPTLT